MAKLKKDGKLLFGSVPLLEIDGQKLVQSNSIVRYIWEKAGFIPENLENRTRMNVLYDGTRDLAPHYMLPLGIEGQDTELRNTIITRIQPTYLPVFNQVLVENGIGYLVGNSITLADLGLLEPLLNMEDYLGAQHLDDYPALKEFVKKIKGQTYMTKYRAKKNDKKLFNEVKTTLPHLFK